MLLSILIFADVLMVIIRLKMCTLLGQWSHNNLKNAGRSYLDMLPCCEHKCHLSHLFSFVLPIILENVETYIYDYNDFPIALNLTTVKPAATIPIAVVTNNDKIGLISACNLKAKPEKDCII